MLSCNFSQYGPSTKLPRINQASIQSKKERKKKNLYVILHFRSQGKVVLLNKKHGYLQIISGESVISHIPICNGFSLQKTYLLFIPLQTGEYWMFYARKVG